MYGTTITSNVTHKCNSKKWQATNRISITAHSDDCVRLLSYVLQSKPCKTSIPSMNEGNREIFSVRCLVIDIHQSSHKFYQSLI